ncbi:uroporphyrinogen-III synthase [Novosphingobium chloroacetimidivorans]|uniref:Uroporphyrinogen-III synthase n=1 Tax=Novosphingobium chloroacetimidivorans TaxID=1428314 RepID=A0A7W7K821_9SPHN|nr:uroporphyrinogen-III synthase [Novosphingobium chloroacetimidivorans]MBB4857670.1 uroporphyrinogen-III synthase [Novosphingobium chloroacetimidivorans]
MRRLIVVRPEPGATATVEAARLQGLQADAYPIFVVRPMPWEPLPREVVDAVLLGSANALRHGGPALAALRGLPSYCVGQTTGDAAGAAGFDVVAVGTGGLQNVLEALAPNHRRLLRLTGAAHVPLDLPPGITVETRAVYASDALPLPSDLQSALDGGGVVMLHSGEAARHFDRLCAPAVIDRAGIALATIGPRVSALAGEGWSEVRSAPRPSDAALLALAREMCQDAAGEAEIPR